LAREREDADEREGPAAFFERVRAVVALRPPDPLRVVEDALRREAPRCVDVVRAMRGLSCEKACVR
jgi:hypothetical protein